MKFTFLIILFLAFSTSVFSQETLSGEGLKRNVVYGTVGTVVVYGVANGNYERMIIDRKGKFISSYWMRVAAGTWGAWGPQGGPHYLTGITALTGSKNSHIELHVGLNAMYDKINYEDDIEYYGSSGPVPDKKDYWDMTAAGAFGYRFQKPGGHFMFRVGLGYPETAYLGLGFCF